MLSKTCLKHNLSILLKLSSIWYLVGWDWIDCWWLVSGASVSESVGSFLTTSYIPRPSKVIKLQPPGLFSWLRGTNFTPFEDSLNWKMLRLWMLLKLCFSGVFHYCYFKGNVWANSWTFIVYKIFSGPLLWGSFSLWISLFSRSREKYRRIAYLKPETGLTTNSKLEI